MNLDRVTITGADMSVDPRALADLSEGFPFVEWGILFSARHEGAPRYPGRAWREKLQTLARGTPMKLSLHLCGRRLRELLLGANELPIGLLEGFRRMQLNFHAEPIDVDTKFFDRVGELFECGTHQFIFQIDGNQGGPFFDNVRKCLAPPRLTEDPELFVPLFDVSHGAGVLPDEWPKPITPGLYHGYAGGLGPDTLEHQLPAVAAAADGCRIWIDMETRVRSEGDLQFDLAKVQRVLELTAPIVARTAAAKAAPAAAA